MNRAIPDDVVEEIRHRCNIVDVIGSFIPLKRAGGGSYKALCPFHQEKTPSFTVNENKQAYHCFGCGKSGDVFRFIMDRENVDFPNAVHLLAARCGVVIPERSDPVSREAGRARANARERLYNLNEAFAVFFQRTLRENPQGPAGRYLAGRGIDRETAEKFRIGASPDEWDACVKYGRSLGYTEAELVESGVVRRQEQSGRLYDHFKGRLTFSIWNEQGRVVGFSARVLEADAKTAKYVNTPETPVFKKGNILYALPLARQAMRDFGMAILCEGQLDTIAMHRGGFACAVAPQGTGFTAEQARLLKRYTECVTLAFDADSAGQKAILRALELLLPLDFEVKVIRIPGGKDPDELFRNGGEAAVRAVVEGASDWLSFLCGSLPSRYDMQSPVGRSRAIGEVLNYLKLINNPITCELYVREVGTILNVSEESLSAELGRLTRQARRAFNGAAAGAAPASEKPERPAALPAAVQSSRPELMLLELALNFESTARYLGELLPPELLSASPAAKALNLVIGCALNGEFEHAAASVGELLQELPDPEIGRILVSDCAFSERSAGRAATDCVKELKRRRNAALREELLAELRRTESSDAKRAIMEKILQLS